MLVSTHWFKHKFTQHGAPIIRLGYIAQQNMSTPLLKVGSTGGCKQNMSIFQASHERIRQPGETQRSSPQERFQEGVKVRLSGGEKVKNSCAKIYTTQAYKYEADVE